MNFIDLGEHGVIAINIFPVDPADQSRVVDAIRGAADRSPVPGLLSAHLLCSDDGTEVINHMHWVSAAAFERATAEDPLIRRTARVVTSLLRGGRPRGYREVALTTPGGSPAEE
jgi:heme-degrading monooxygenase HmoA